MTDDLYYFLKARLNRDSLPGRALQIKMAPVPKDDTNPTREMEAPPEANDSSVLILIFPNEDDMPELVLTLRSRGINHGGQISFPGGRAEQGESTIETALREAREEIGINPEDVKITGTISKLYVAHSDNHVTPVVGFLDYTPELTLNPNEVEEAFSIELDSLLNKENLTVEDWELRENATFRVPYWDVHQVPLWGATAMILSEFLELYREFKEQSNK